MPEWHFLRPGWLFTLIPLAVFLVCLWRRAQSEGGWENLVDDALKPHVLEGVTTTRRVLPFLFGTLLSVLAVLILAGPVWEQRPQPMLQAASAQVIALDVSRSMDTADQKPTRLTRAKHKVSDLLKLSAGVQTALVVFSEVAYVVSPLTDDVATLEAFLPAIETSVVPVQGSRLAPAIVKSRELLEQAGQRSGSIILITDATVHSAALDAAEAAREAGFRVSVLAVATRAGDPVRLADDSLLEDQDGNIAVTRLDESGLKNLASSGNGVFQELTIDNGDIDSLAEIGQAIDQVPVNELDRVVMQWFERGPWALLLLLLGVLPVFRRGVL